MYQQVSGDLSGQYPVQSDSSVSYIWYIAICIAVVLIGIAMLSSGEEKTNKFTTLLYRTPKTMEDFQAIKSIEEMRQAIDNTVWTYTKRGSLVWLKMEFKKDKVRIYRAFPSDGQWTFDEDYPYSLEEGRFMDDGRRYIAAVIECKDLSISPKFIITNGHLSWLGLIDVAGFVLGDYEWD